MKKTVIITGASRGFGKTWAEAFLKRGDNVVATSRNIDGLQDLVTKYGDAVLPLKLNVISRENCFAVVRAAVEEFGHIDAVINNAGYAVFGAVEEHSEKEAKDLFDVNVFGTLWMTQAILPVFREQGSGHILQLSSVLGINSLPTMGLYSATKFAVEGFSEALQEEVKEFGIKITLIEPNSFATDFFGSSSIQTRPLGAYAAVKAAFNAGDGIKPENIGYPAATAGVILDLVDNENPPLRLFLGKLAYPWTQYTYSRKLALWEQWKDVSIKSHGH